MSNSVVTAAAAVHAKKLAKNAKLAKQHEQRKAAADDQVPADKDQDNAHVVEAKEGQNVTTSMSNTSLAGDFTFGAAMADAAGSASLTSVEAQSDGSYGDDDDDAGISGTLLLVGAIALVGLGIAVLVGGGGNKNEAPTFASATQTRTTAEDTPVSVTATATDPDGDPLTYTVSGATNGTVTGTNGAYTFTPAANFNGTGSFTVTATDPDGLTTTQNITITVTPVNDAPTAPATLTLTTNEDTAVTGSVGATDADGNTLTYTITDQADKGTATVGANGAITYTPNANANGTDTFVVSVSDGTATTTQTVTVNITPVNDGPVSPAGALAVSGDEDTDIIVTSGITDADGDPLTFTVTTAPENGTTVVNPDGTITFTPDADFDGTDSFVITATDPSGGTVTRTVNVTVNAVNDAPVADAENTESLTIDEDSSGTIIIAFTDPDGDEVEATLVSGPENGTLTQNDDGTLTYTPDEDFNGEDEIVYTIGDGENETTYTIPITVTPVNDDPMFGAEEVDIIVDEDETFEGTLTATDADDDDLTFSLGDDAENGTVTVEEDGSYTYTPDDGFLGDDSYTVIVDDGNGGTDELTVNVSVRTTNIAPSFDDDSVDIDVDQDTAFTGDLNASDDNDDDLTFTVTDDPANGEVVINDDGTFTFTPDDGFVGDDSFVITVDDGRGGTDTLEVNVSVDPAVNEVSIDRGTPTVSVTVPSGTDADPDTDAVVFTDDAAVNTNVIISGFGEDEDDIIAVTGATADDYSFSTGTGPGGENDLQIVFNNTEDNAVNLILLVDVLNGGFVGDYETAVASVGYDFMTFG